MSFTFVSPAIPATNIKMRWREPYVSSGINKKLAGVVPSGIYRGLRLGTSGSALTVTIAPDPTTLDHLAVYETADGFSITYRDPTNTTYSLLLSDAGLVSQTLVIALYMDYQESAATTATYIAYTLAEYVALSAAYSAELIVLGTVVNPAAGVISASSITDNRRTDAANRVSVPTWRPLMANTGFDRSIDGHVITGNETEAWTTTATGNSQWKTTSTGVSTGIRCAEYNLLASGTYTDSISQSIGAGVLPGQRIAVKMSKKVLTAAGSGSATITLGFTGSDGGSATQLTSPVVITSTDAAYVVLNPMFVTPTGMVSLNYIRFDITAAVYAAAGSKIRIDDFNARLLPIGVEDQLNSNDDRLRSKYLTSMVVEDIASTSYSDKAAALRYAGSTPTNEGTLHVERKDRVAASLPPAIGLHGRLYNLGSDLVSTAANARLPRLSAPVSTVAGSYTLVNEYARDGETSGGYTKPVVRVYVDLNGIMYTTTNAVWGGATWSRDVAAYASSISWQTESSSYFDTLTSTENATPWADPWIASSSRTSPILSATPSGVTVGTDLTLDVGDVALATGKVQHAARYRFQECFPFISISGTNAIGTAGSAGAYRPVVTCTGAGCVISIPLNVQPFERLLRVDLWHLSQGAYPGDTGVATLVRHGHNLLITAMTASTVATTLTVGGGITSGDPITYQLAVNSPVVCGSSITDLKYTLEFAGGADGSDLYMIQMTYDVPA